MSLRSKFTEKQIGVIHSYLNCEFKMMILSGAVRSGKTYVDNYLFLMDLKRANEMAVKRKDKHPQYILAGYSSNSIYNNVISSIGTQFGIELNADRHGHYHLFDIDIVTSYTGNIRGVDSIRGMTSYGAYINEASLANEAVFQEIKQRCSIPGAHIIGDTNPDNPQHWLKKNYIDKASADTKTVYFHFTIDDNPTLDPEYVETMKKTTPTGMYYDRAIKGLWVNGEGAVYRDFDERKTVIDKEAVPEIRKYYAGVDWGYEHKGSIVVFGDDYQGNTYLLEEHTSQYKEIDYWVDVARDVQKKYGDIHFWCDTARPEHIARFVRENIDAGYADKSVLSGIESVAKLIKTDRFFVVRQAVTKTDTKQDTFYLEEIYNYAWDEKTGMPIKLMDDVMDAKRYAIYTEHQDTNEISTIGGII